MKKLILFMFVFISMLLVYSVSGNSHEHLFENDIKKVLDDSEQGWNSGDIERYMECYHRSDKMRFAGNGSFNFGWENTLKRYKKSYPDKKAMGKLTFSDVDITILSDDAAFIFGRWTLHYPDKKRTGLYTLVMRKFKEGWKIVHDHSSSGK
ncbi:MAG: nuclear transport factor 2 family protein [Acidobacteriota bacterium]